MSRKYEKKEPNSKLDLFQFGHLICVSDKMSFRDLEN